MRRREFITGLGGTAAASIERQAGGVCHEADAGGMSSFSALTAITISVRLLTFNALRMALT